MDVWKIEFCFVIFIFFFYSSFSISLNVTEEARLGKIPEDLLIKNIVKYYDSVEENVRKILPGDPDLLRDHWLGDISKLRGVEESVCGDTDERTRISDSKTQTGHFQWTCWLKIFAKKNSGGYWTGTGFILDIPGISGSVMLTSAHCIWLGGYYGGIAGKIVVQCPGYDPVEVYTDDLHADVGYIENGSADHDIGAIYLKEKFDSRKGALDVTGFPWTNALTSAELGKKKMSTNGYPGDKVAGTMWSVGGDIQKVDDQRIYYMADTYGGQSGSPVYVDIGDGGKTVVAVHGYGGCPNSAVRLTREHMTPILEHVNYQGLSVGIRSYYIPNAYLRANGPSSVVNAQFGCYKNGAESFDVLPVQVTSDGVKVILSPKAWPNMVISLEKRRNCSVKLTNQISSKAVFTVSQNGNNGTFSFYHENDNIRNSVGDKRVYLRLHADDVTTWRENGGGSVTCGHQRSHDDVFDLQPKEHCNL